MNNPIYEISSDYPSLNSDYPYLVSIAVLLPQVLIGPFAGVLTDNFDRVTLLSIGCILWSSTNFFAANIHDFNWFCSMRVMFGIISACCYSPSVSLIRDYFPKEKRGLANSIFSSYFYLGACISSLSTLLVKDYGWRATYDIISFFGVTLGFTCLLVLYEPRRTN